MQKLIIFILLSLVWSTSSFALSKATEDKFFDTCMEGASKSGKNQKLQIKYCTCIVDYIDERYSDEQFLKALSLALSHFENLEEYENCAILKKIQDVANPS